MCHRDSPHGAVSCAPFSAPRLIRERGRWDGDIMFVYARPSVTAHLVLSAQMGDHARADIESLLASLQMSGDPNGSGPFAQPAWI